MTMNGGGRVLEEEGPESYYRRRWWFYGGLHFYGIHTVERPQPRDKDLVGCGVTC